MQLDHKAQRAPLDLGQLDLLVQLDRKDHKGQLDQEQQEHQDLLVLLDHKDRKVT